MMSVHKFHLWQRQQLGRKPWCFLFIALLFVQPTLLAAQDELQQEAQDVQAPQDPPRLLDLPPFDRITLKESYGRETIDTLLLDIPGRKLPAPLPTEGELKLKRVSEPSVLYSVPWAAIEKIEFYEQLLLAEAIELTGKKDFIEAYSYLSFLHNHYPKLRGLTLATERYLKRDALNSFTGKRYDEALTILLSLYDLNPKHSGLAAAVQAVTDRMIKGHLASKDFGAARTVLDSVEASFSQLDIKNIKSWRSKFQAGAEKQLAEARKYAEQGEFNKARVAIRRAIAILPTIENSEALIEEINRRSPQVIVGVSRHSVAPSSAKIADVAAVRVASLTQPQFVELSDFGGEGGIYSCKWADFEIDDSGLNLNVRLNEQATTAGISPEAVALQLLRTTDSTVSFYQENVAGLLQSTSILGGQEVHVRWKWPHVRPETHFRIPLKAIASNESTISVYEPVHDSSDKNTLLYDLPGSPPGKARPPSIVEQIYSNEEAALTAIVRGEVDVLQRIAPWHLDRLRRSEDIVVDFYRLPTIHVLVPNYSKALVRRREFRRALCFGIDRQRIVKDIILGGKSLAGFQVLSGPLPAGLSLSDPLGYAYKQSIKPRPYEPRLAAVLATVARTTLAEVSKENQSESESQPSADESSNEQQPSTSETEPIVLLHPPDTLARTTCQTMKMQLNAIGIPIKLLELSPHLNAESVDYDLEYVELPLWEPLVDLRRLLGPMGRIGKCSPAMSLALTSVDRARNWKEARTRLQDLHDVAFHDLPVIPLWQTVNFFAYRETLQGVTSSPVVLYQNVAQWRTSFLGGGQ